MLMSKIEKILSVLPQIQKEMIEQAAKSIGCPIEYPLAGYLAAMSIVSGNSHILEIKQNYSVNPVLFIGFLGDAGSKKTPSLNMMLSPIFKIQQGLVDEHNNNEESEMDDNSSFSQVITSDSTTEAIAVLLKNNSHGILIFLDELAALLKSLNQYKSSGNDMETYLSYWSSSMIVINRKSLKEPIFIKNPFVSIIGGIQPMVLKNLPNFNENGLPERFLYFYPKSDENRYSTYVMDENLVERYNEICVKLYKKYQLLSNKGTPKKLKFTTEAQEKWTEWAIMHSEEMYSPIVPIYLRSYWSKLESFCGRIALLFEINQEQYIEEDCEYVSIESLKNSIILIDFFKEEARKVWQLFDGNPSYERDLAKVKDWINTNQKDGFVRKRDILNTKMMGIKTIKDVEGLFEDLEMDGFGKPATGKNQRGQSIQGFAVKGSKAYRFW